MSLISRRQMLSDAASGFGTAALGWILHQQQLLGAAPSQVHDLRPKKPHLTPKAKSVIYLYMGGGPSTIDMFDPKPVLNMTDRIRR